jgi:predicted nuclease of predicted toxin-antitoxin system
VGLSGADDPRILEWAAGEDRILLTHDITTMKDFAYARVAAGQPMPGVIVVRKSAAVGQVIEDLLLAVEATTAEEWQAQVRYLPP